jgi:uncharacterized damage-inducible protein DinB
MNEIERINDQLRRASDGNAWHGPALREILAGITAKQAAAKPLSAAHSIWELVQHIAVWEDVVRRRLEGEVIVEVPTEQDWPAVSESDEPAWRETVARLERGQQALSETIARFDARRLDETVPGTNYSFYVMLHGVVQHDLYHAGQIAILKKAGG